MAKRNYKKEYKKFHSSKKAIEKRSETNADRAKINAERKKKGLPPLRKDQEVGHYKDKNGKVRTRVVSAKKNRGSNKDMPGDKRARGKGQKKRQPKRGRKKSS